MSVYKNYEKNYHLSTEIDKLKPMEKSKIVCGRKYGLPFDYLMTDIFSGCLNLNNVCYGNCTAAQFWVKNGYDFGKKILNEFDFDLFEESIKSLPKEQKWIRQGWISDCSFSDKSWELIAYISDILIKHDITLLIITKIHKIPSKEIMKKLANNQAEIRVSLSALDTKIEVERRLKFLQEYREMGGISVPYLMTSRYKNKTLKNNQNYIIKYIVENNFIAGEHPLRVDKDNPIFREMEDDGFYHPKYPNQYWFGRILDTIDNFILPAPTHLKPNYRLKYNKISKDSKNIKIPGIESNLPTYQDLKENKYTKEMFDHATYSIQKYK